MKHLFVSLSARRAWIEMAILPSWAWNRFVALRKESVDRNGPAGLTVAAPWVALRKESVDRNVASGTRLQRIAKSLSARRAWIEILPGKGVQGKTEVALRKESVDRNTLLFQFKTKHYKVALRKESVDRNDKWEAAYTKTDTVALRKESVDRNCGQLRVLPFAARRSPQGERG